MKFPKPIKRVKKIKRLKRQRKTPMAILERKAWTVFSKWIRTRDMDKMGHITCYTCPKVITFNEAEAGHYISRGRKIVKFDPMNVHSQCPRCNRFLHGNLGEYTFHLIIEYSFEDVMTLKRLGEITHKFTREELEGIIKKYSLER